MTVRQTHTYALMEVSERTFTEIARKLREAGYDHAFMADEPNVVPDIDMHGIGLRCLPDTMTHGYRFNPADRSTMSLSKLAELFETQPRQGEEHDVPEGVRFIQISETMVDQLVALLRLYSRTELPDGTTLAEFIAGEMRHYAAKWAAAMEQENQLDRAEGNSAREGVRKAREWADRLAPATVHMRAHPTLDGSDDGSDAARAVICRTWPEVEGGRTCTPREVTCPGCLVIMAGHDAETLRRMRRRG